MRKLLSLIAMLVMSVTMLMAQDKTITGSVIGAEDGEPVIGASVLVTGTQIGTVTDLDGKFSLNISFIVPQKICNYYCISLTVQQMRCIVRGISVMVP